MPKFNKLLMKRVQILKFNQPILTECCSNLICMQRIYIYIYLCCSFYRLPCNENWCRKLIEIFRTLVQLVLHSVLTGSPFNELVQASSSNYNVSVMNLGPFKIKTNEFHPQKCHMYYNVFGRS